MAIRLAVLVSHPIQYFSPVYRELCRIPDIDLTVLYCSRHGVEHREDKKFGVSLAWDIPLLDGYVHKFLQAWKGHDSPGSVWGLVNPDVLGELSGDRYDVLIVHGYRYVTCWLAFLAAKVRRIPFLIRGDSHLLRRRPWWRRAAKRAPLAALFQAASGYLAIGSRSARYARFYGMPEDKVYVAPYCVDNRFFDEGANQGRQRREETLAELELSSDLTVFAFFGKLYAGKAPVDLLRAFQRIDTSKAALIYVGQGEDRGRLEGYALSRGIENVRFTGFVNQGSLPRYYAITDVAVLPSHGENWGLVVNEAMASGCAVVVSDVCGCAVDLVREGRNGFTFAAGDVGVLYRIMARFVENREMATMMGEASREIIRDWSPGVCAEKIADAVRDVVL